MSLKFSLLTSFFLIISFVGQSQINKEKPLTESGVDGPTSVLIVDLDGDGLNDIITTSETDNKVGWFKNLGNGAFSSSIVISTSLSDPQDVDAQDIDGDGDMDLLVASENDNKIAWFKNDGNQDFGAPILLTYLADDASSVFLSDLDGDGDFDALSTSRSDDNVSWYENLGGSFGPRQTITTLAEGASSVTAADLDGDGDNDVIASSKDDSEIAWYENLGNGSFGVQNIISSSSYQIAACTVSDLDNDGDIDIIGTIPAFGTVEWFENNGSGVFAATQIISTVSTWIYSVNAEDLDNDGDDDLTFTSWGSSTVYWQENLGGANFGTENVLSSNALNAISVYAGDLDNDGFSDIAYAAKSTTITGKISWQRNLANGTFDTEQVLTVAPSQHIDVPYSVFSSDLDNDGDMDILSSGAKKIVWHENLGSGVFDSLKIISDQMVTAQSTISADLDNDGDQDIVSGSYTGDLIWHANLGNGVFGVEQTISTVSNTGLRQIRAFDMDSDGDLDILTASSIDDVIAWVENLGGGVFGPRQVLATMNNAWSIDIGDMDGDGDLDIIASGVSTVIWYENVNSTYSTLHTVTSVYDWYESVKVADMDGDSDMDIVVSGSSSGDIRWYRNENGNFTWSYLITTLTNTTRTIDVVDLDGDGKMDVISASNQDNKVAWYKNYGGNFGAQQIISTNAAYSWSVCTADLDGDNDLDVISASLFDDKIAWYLNEGHYQFQGQGSFYIDLDQNGLKDSTDAVFNQTYINVTPLSIDSYYEYTNGEYFVAFIDTIPQTYILEPEPVQYWDITSDSLFYTAIMDTNFQLSDSLDFGFYSNTILDSIEVDLTGGIPRCGTMNYWLTVRNMGTTIPSGTIRFDFDNIQGYLGADVTPDSIVGQSVYWNYDSLFYFDDTMINIQLVNPLPSGGIDSLICFATGTIIESNNVVYSATHDSRQRLICSYDPNDKLSDPLGIDSMGYMDPLTPDLEYTIRFKNTGSDTAFVVVITDQLDTNFVWNSFSLIANSHDVDIGINQSGFITFTFDNILLPDSAANNLGSEGFVKFKLDLKENLPLGQSIYNTAQIYFDTNEPIITNTKINTLYDCGNLLGQIPTSPMILCENDPFIVEEGISTTLYNWELGTIDSVDVQSVSWPGDVPGTYDMHIGASNVFCSDTLDFQINIIPSTPITELSTMQTCYSVGVDIFNQSRDTAGIYYDTLQTINGCDSILSQELFVYPEIPVTSVGNNTICQGDSLLIFNQYQQSPGVYYNTLQGANGCDSVISHELNINTLASNYWGGSIFICSGDSILVFNQYQQSPGVYTETLQSIYGCDSTVSIGLNLIPNLSVTTLPSDFVCEGDSVSIFNEYQHLAGTYYDTLQSVNGCDSIVSKMLDVIPELGINSIGNFSICEGDNMLVFSQYQHVSGTYYDTLQSINGCDSIISFDLTTITVNNSVNQTGNQLTASESGANYQWLSCPSMTEIIGETSQTFNALENGDYAVVTTIIGCPDTSSCYTISGIGLQENTFGTGFQLYPNPTDNVFNIDLGQLFGSVTITITELNGKVLQKERFMDVQIVSLTIDKPSGCYLVTVESNTGKAVIQLIKE